MNVADQHGDRPLHKACKGGHVQIVSQLLEYNAVVGAQNNDGTTSLHLASTTGAVSVVKKLIEYGADVNGMDNQGHTALFSVYKAIYDSPVFFAGTESDGGRDLGGQAMKEVRLNEARDEIITTLIASGADLEGEFTRHPDVMDKVRIHYFLSIKDELADTSYVLVDVALYVAAWLARPGTSAAATRCPGGIVLHESCRPGRILYPCTGCWRPSRGPSSCVRPSA